MTEREQGFRAGVEAAAKVCEQLGAQGNPTIHFACHDCADAIRTLTPPADGAGALLRECLGWLRQSYAPEIDDLRKRIEAHLSGKDRT